MHATFMDVVRCAVVALGVSPCATAGVVFAAGQMAPDGSGTMQYVGLNSVTPGGRLSVIAATATAADSQSNVVWVFDPAMRLMLTLREGENGPDGPLVAGSFSAQPDDTGGAIVRAGTRLYRWRTGQYQPLIGISDPAPLVPGAIISAMDRHEVSSDGVVWVRATLAGVGVEDANDQVVYRFVDGQPPTLLREGSTRPDGQGFGSPSLLTGWGATGGIHCFQPTGVYAADSVGVQPVLQAGDMLSPSGLSVVYVLAAHASRCGSFAVAIQTNSNVHANEELWIGTAGAMTRAAMMLGVVPGMPEARFSRPVDMAAVTPIAAGPCGHFAVASLLYDGRRVRFLHTPAGGWELALVNGDALPGGGLFDVRAGVCALDGAGGMVFFQQDGLQTQVYGRSASGEVVRLLGTGDSVTVDGMSYPIAINSLHARGLTSTYGTRMWLTDDGRVYFRANLTGLGSVVLTARVPGSCDPIDFNADGLVPDTNDIADFLAVLAGGICSFQQPGDPPCNTDIDFNNDGLFPDTTDIDSLLSVFSGGPCL